MSLHLNYSEISKDGFGNFLNALKQAAKSIEPQILHMLYLRVSQINGCAYCVDLHYRDAIACGVDGRKLNSLSVWHETIFFSEKERVLLQWIDDVTLLQGVESYKNHIEQLKEFFSEKEIVEGI